LQLQVTRAKMMAIRFGMRTARRRRTLNIMTPEPLSAMEPEPKGMSEPSRLVGVFFETTKTFEDIAARPRFWAPMILVMLVGLAVVTMFTQRVGWERMARQQMELNPQIAQQLTPEQRETRVQFMGRFGSLFGYGGALLGTPITFLILAGIYLGMTRGIMAAPITFKQAFAAVCYGWLPNVIAGLLTIAVMMMKNPDEFRLDNPLVFNPGAFMDPVSSNKFLLSVATSLDLFTLWSMFLIAVGLKAAGGKKLSMSSAMVAVFLPWAGYVLCKSALAGLRG